MAIKYFFEKMWFYMKYIVKNRGWRILMSMDCTIHFRLKLYTRVFLRCGSKCCSRTDIGICSQKMSSVAHWEYSQISIRGQVGTHNFYYWSTFAKLEEWTVLYFVLRVLILTQFLQYDFPIGIWNHQFGWCMDVFHFSI
jgi:hypothetical protein